MLGSPGARTLALPKSHSFSTWLAASTSRFCGGRDSHAAQPRAAPVEGATKGGTR